MGSPWRLLRSLASRLLVLAAAAVALLVLVSAGPILLGRKSYIVLGGSMEPAIPVGSVVVTEVVRPSQVQEGDIITYVPRSELVTTHRVVRVVRDQFGLGFQTRGDANGADDPELVRPPNLLGRVVYTVPLAGYLLHFGNQPATRWAVLIALLVALAVSFARSLRRRAVAAPALEPQPRLTMTPTDGAPSATDGPPAPANSAGVGERR